MVRRKTVAVVLGRLIQSKAAAASNFRLSLPADSGDAARAGAVADCISAADAADAAARKMDKSNELSVPSRRRMDSDMSHLILKDGATFSYIWY